MSRGILMVVDIAIYHVPEDPEFPAPMEGCVVAGIQCVVTPIPLFTTAVLWIRATQSTPSGILHITTFVALCEAFIGIHHHFNMWNHFFHVWLPQGSDAEVAVLGGVVIHVKSEHGFNPYFNIPLPKLNNGWRKMWFFLRNNAAASLPTFIGNRPIPQTNWGYVVAKKYLRKLQTLREVVQQLP
jgi:hypothetical protein